jgi:hypothetical protein
MTKKQLQEKEPDSFDNRKRVFAQVCRMQCGSEGKTLFLDTSTQTMYNEDGSVFVPSVLHKSCNMLPVPLEYIEIEVKDEENTDFRTEVPHIVPTQGGEELQGNLSESSGEVQPGSVLRYSKDVSGRVVEAVEPPDEIVSAGTISEAKSFRPTRRTKSS